MHASIGKYRESGLGGADVGLVQHSYSVAAADLYYLKTDFKYYNFPRPRIYLRIPYSLLLSTAAF
jgi:hypothetical protein